MDREELVDAVEGLDTDEIADLVDDLPPDVVAEVQEGLSHEERAQLRAAMSYPEDSVGARMDFEMISIRQDVSLEIVLKFCVALSRCPIIPISCLWSIARENFWRVAGGADSGA